MVQDRRTVLFLRSVNCRPSRPLQTRLLQIQMMAAPPFLAGHPTGKTPTDVAYNKCENLIS